MVVLGIDDRGKNRLLFGTFMSNQNENKLNFNFISYRKKMKDYSVTNQALLTFPYIVTSGDFRVSQILLLWNEKL